MDAYFPTAEDMQFFVEVAGVFVGFGLGLSACVWALGLLIRFITSVFKEV